MCKITLFQKYTRLVVIIIIIIIIIILINIIIRVIGQL
jgi:hypothetical protein